MAETATPTTAPDPFDEAHLARILEHVPNCRYGCIACEATPGLAATIRQLRRQLEAAEAQPCDHNSDAFEALERLHGRIHRDFNFDAGECAPPTEDEIALRLMDDLVAFADEVYLPLADATKVPGPLESAVTEALADIANDDPADPEPVQPPPPWLVPAGDD